MPRESVVLLTLIAYKVVLLTIGFLAERRTRDEADFLLGGRRLGPLVAAISASASSSSVWTLLGVSGFAYAKGLHALWLLPACVGGFALNWFLVAPRLRRRAAERGSLTLTEFLAGRDRGAAYRPARIAAALIVVVSLTAYVSYQFQGAGKTFSTYFGLSATSSMLIGAAVVVAYTMLGGFWAVSLTDTLQGLLMALTAVALPVAALIAVGGFGALRDGLAAVEADGYTALSGAAEGWPAAAGIAVLLAIGIGYPGQPHVVNRFMALGDDGAVRRARLYSMLWAMLVYPGMILLGLCGRLLTAEVMTDDEAVFFALTNQLFSPVVAGVMAAAVLSAIMSTADSQLLVASGSISHDLGVAAGGGRRTLLTSRAVVLVLSAAAVVFAVWASAKIFAGVLFAWTALGAAFGPLLVVTLWRGPVGPRRTLWAMVAGFSITVVANNIDATRSGVVERVVPYVVALAIAVGRDTGHGRR